MSDIKYLQEKLRNSFPITQNGSLISFAMYKMNSFKHSYNELKIHDYKSSFDKNKIKLDYEYRTFSTNIYNNQEYLLNIIKSYQHFQNMLIMLITNEYEAYYVENDKLLKKRNSKAIKEYPKYHFMLMDASLIRDLCAGYQTKNKNKDEQKNLLKMKLENNDVFKEFLKLGKKFQPKSIYLLVNKIQGAYKSFFTKIKNKDRKAKPPRTIKLDNISSFAIPA